MSGSLMRNAALHRVLRNRLLSDPPTTASSSFQNHTTALSPRPYCRLSQLFKRPTFRQSTSDLAAASSSSSSSVSRGNGGVVGWYLEMLNSRPVLTKSVTATFIYVAADLLSQTLAQPVSEVNYDVGRTLRMAGYGLLILGPSLHYWFNLMSKLFPKRDVRTIFKKIAIGQLFYGPCMTVVFFALNAFLQGENSDEIVARLKRDLLPTMRNGVMYWPICDFITFRFIPLQLQPLVCNSFSYLWTVYMTYMASLAKVEATI